MRGFNFGPAFEKEDTIFGARGPLDESEIKEWMDFMKENNIKHVVCLLPEEQLGKYPSLLKSYKKEFGENNVLWAPIEDFTLCDKNTLETILNFLDNAFQNKEKVVVHCLGGSGRTGHILAAWLVFSHKLDIKEALSAVKGNGRNPYEAISTGNSEKEDLFDLLNLSGS